MSPGLSARSRSVSAVLAITATLLLGTSLTLALLLIFGRQTQSLDATSAMPGCGDYEDVDEKPFQQLDFDKLDYGIYWFGRDNHCRKTLPGEANPYFDAARPTVLYVHGWEADTTRRHFRETFYLKPDYPDVPEHFNTANAWIEDGWNVGIFYWNQFSDETAPGLAEGKIWSATSPAAMRWRNPGGSFSPGPAQSAGELFYEAYVDALGNVPNASTRNANIRLVGHSLGSQLVVYGAKLISERRPNLLPNRIALLDPHFSLGPQPYLSEGAGGGTAERINSYVDALKLKGVAFEQYQSTALGDITGSVPGFGGNDANPDLQKKTAFARLYPDYVPWLNPLVWFHDQHVAAISWYFWSYSYQSIPQCAAGVGGQINQHDKSAPSARSTDAEIKAFMAAGSKFVQVHGKGSADPGKSCLAPIARSRE